MRQGCDLLKHRRDSSRISDIGPNDHGLATLGIYHLGHSVCGCAIAAVVYNGSIIALGSGRLRSCGASAGACASYK